MSNTDRCRYGLGFCIVSVLILTLVIISRSSASQTSPVLNLGDPVPSLKTVEWIKGVPVKDFDPAKVYIIEFWATWCGPCREAMPHISELAEKYKGQVSVIGVSVLENRESELSRTKVKDRVSQFVHAMGRRMNYAIALDDTGGTVYHDWEVASGDFGVPHAYIVKDRKLQWIGQPADLDAPLAEIFNGSYDIEAARRRRQEDKADNDAWEAIIKSKSMTDARRANDYATQLKLWEEALARNPKLENLEMFKSQGGLYPILLGLDHDRAIRYAHDFIAKNGTDPKVKAGYLQVIALDTVYHSPKIEDLQLKDLAVGYAREAVALSKMPTWHSAYDLSLLAAAYFADNDLPHAIEAQSEAVKIAQDLPKYDTRRDGMLKKYLNDLHRYEAKRSVGKKQ